MMEVRALVDNLNNIIVYHGSYMEVQQPDLNKCKENKDFGKGFYITTDRNQAIKFARLIAERYNTTYGVLNEYVLTDIEGLTYHGFENTDMEWLNCVVGNRKKKYRYLAENWESFDILSGKVANDDTSTVINAYLLGIYGEIGAETAGKTAIANLEPENLKNQLCFRTEEAIAKLNFVKSEKVDLVKGR